MTDPGQQSLGDFDTNGSSASDTDQIKAEAKAVADEDNVEQVIDPERYSLPAADGTIAISITQVDYTIEGTGENERPIIHVFGRTGDGTAEHIQIRGFQPYFYAPADSVDKSDLLNYDAIVDWEETDEDEEPYQSIRENELVRIYTRTPRDVGRIRDDFEHYEADILFPDRFLIDKGLNDGIAVPKRRDDDSTIIVHHSEVAATTVNVDPRVCFLDIEVDDRHGFPEDGEEPIICLTTHDSYDDEYIGWLYKPDTEIEEVGNTLSDYQPLQDDTEIKIKSYETEEEMLDEVIQYIEQKDVDILSGWNFTDFDAPYLLDRLEELNDRTNYDLDIDRLSRVNEVWRSDWGGPDVKGRVVFDLLYAYQRTKFTELDSYRLDDVGERELGVGKERYQGDLGDLWEENPERLLEYNLRDVELCVELNRTQDIIPFWNEVKSFVGCRLEDATTPGDAVDIYVLQKVHGDFALPSKGQHSGEDYEGGAVFDPITGVRENVSVLDLKSLYPMCMVTINASPETKVNPEEYGEDTYIAPNDTHFRKEPDGIIREMVDELLNEREAKKEQRNEFDPETEDYERFDRQQAAVKVIMNCFTPDTEVLTPNGIQNIRDLKVGEEVYSLDPDTKTLETKPVIKTHAYPEYRGKLLDIQTDTIDFRVTSNHRMLIQEPNAETANPDITFTKAGNLDDQQVYEIPTDWQIEHEDQLPDQIQDTDLSQLNNGIKKEVTDGGVVTTSYPQEAATGQITTNDWLNVLAQYLIYGRTKTNEDKKDHIVIEMSSPASLTGSVQAVTAEYKIEEGEIHITDPRVSRNIRSHCHRENERRIPEYVYSGSETQKQQFIDTIFTTEKDQTEQRVTIESKQLRDDILRLCAHVGDVVSYDSADNHWIVRRHTDYEATFDADSDVTESTADNGVYCVTVEDNHTLLAGRNGQFQPIGQSLYGVLGWDRFRLYDKEMGAAVTATGREVINHTEAVANEEGYEVVYGDSVTEDRPVVVRDPDQRVRIIQIGQLYDIATQTSERKAVLSADGGKTKHAGKERSTLDGWEALSLTTDGAAEWQPIQRVIKHETDKPIVELRDEYGGSVTTPDHSYIVEDGDKYTQTAPSDVDAPVRIPSPGGDNSQAEVDVKILLKDKDDQIGNSGNEIGDRNPQDKKILKTINWDTEAGSALSRVSALYIRCGSVANTTTVTFEDVPTEVRSQLHQDCELLFGKQNTQKVENDIVIDDRDAKILCAKLFEDETEKQVPSFILNAPVKQQKRFLKLVTDTANKATESKSSLTGRVFETTSQVCAAGVSYLLIANNIDHTYDQDTESDRYRIVIGRSRTKEATPTLETRETTEPTEVYDLEVKKNNNFVDGVGGIVLHNTDSVMLELGENVEKEKAIERSFDIEKHINKSYDIFAKEELNAHAHRFQIEFEKLYRRFFQAGKKKRYAGHIIWKEGKDVDDIDITGFEYQRSDIASITKEVQLEVIDMIVKGEDIDEVKSYVHSVIDDFQGGKVDPEEIAIPGGIGKRLDSYDTDTAQVRGARYANELLGTNFGRGSKPKRIYLEGVHAEFFQRMEQEHGFDPQENEIYREFKQNPDVICFEYADQLPEEFEIDWEKMLDKTLKGPIERILEALEISWQEVKSGQEQTGLGQFM